MKNILTTLLLLLSIVSFSQTKVQLGVENKNGKDEFTVKMEREVDGKTVVTEKRYNSLEEMKNDPELKDLDLHFMEGNSSSFKSKDGNILIEIDEDVKEGDRKRVFISKEESDSEDVVAYSKTETKNIGSTTNVIEKEYLKGLHKPTDKERESLSLQLSPNLDFYTSEGKKISFSKVLPMLKSGDYTLDPYINANNELKAAVFRPATETERKEIKEGQTKMNKRSERVDKYAQNFDVTDINGNKYSLKELKGKIIVMNFWFVECKPCVMEMPDLNKIAEKYKGKEVVFLGFATNKTPKINSFLSKREFKYNIIPESKDVINSYGITSYPTHIIIDETSKIVFSTSGLGPNTISDLENGIEKYLKK